MPSPPTAERGPARGADARATRPRPAAPASGAPRSLRERTSAAVVSAALRAGWALLPRLPGALTTPLLHAAAALAADATTARGGAGVRQLAANLRRAAPGASERELAALVRAGMRSYLRYFADLLTMTGWSPARVRATSRVVGLPALAEAIGSGRGAVGFLGHLASWDHIGAWAAAELAPVATVAERLEPPALHAAFTTVRARLGIEALPLGGAGTTGRLVRVLRAGGFAPLLADRDLSGSGVPVRLLGEPARAAAGPAALALATGAPLFPITVHYERLPSWSRTRWWRPRWGIVTTVHPPVPVPDPDSPDSPDSPPAPARAAARRAARTAAMTQACVDVVSAAIRADPTDWHLLQPVFDADLARSPRSGGGAAGGRA